LGPPKFGLKKVGIYFFTSGFRSDEQGLIVTPADYFFLCPRKDIILTVEKTSFRRPDLRCHPGVTRGSPKVTLAPRNRVVFLWSKKVTFGPQNESFSSEKVTFDRKNAFSMKSGRFRSFWGFFPSGLACEPK